MTKTATCRSCGAPILWTATPAGNSIPLDAEPRADGNVRLGWVGGVEVAIVLNDPAERAAGQIAGPMFVSHFATCPDADSWRKRTPDVVDDELTPPDLSDSLE